MQALIIESQSRERSRLEIELSKYQPKFLNTFHNAYQYFNYETQAKEQLILISYDLEDIVPGDRLIKTIKKIYSENTKIILMHDYIFKAEVPVLHKPVTNKSLEQCLTGVIEKKNCKDYIYSLLRFVDERKKLFEQRKIIRINKKQHKKIKANI